MDLHGNVKYLAGLTHLIQQAKNTKSDVLDEGDGTINLIEIERTLFNKKYKWNEEKQTFSYLGKRRISKIIE